MPTFFLSSAVDYETAFLQALFWTVLSESLALWVGLFCMQYKKACGWAGWKSRYKQGEGGECDAERGHLHGQQPEGERKPGGEAGDAFALKKSIFTSPWFSPGRIFLGGFFASFATLPYLWFVLPRYLTSYPLYAFGGEAFVIFGEALFYTAYFRLSFKAAFVLSLWCNLASLGVGKLLGLY
jgi:hypothetical protein